MADVPTALRQAVARFDGEEQMEAAIDDLLTAGFDRADLSILAREETVVGKLSRSYERVENLEDDPGTTHAAYVSRESIGGAEGAVIGAPMYLAGVLAAGGTIAAGGPLSLALAAAAGAAGVGGAFGAVLAKMIGEQHGRHIAEQLERGGILLWVRVWDRNDEAKVMRILKTHSAGDVHIHDFAEDGPDRRTPEAIVRSKALSRTQKIAVLRQWEYDLRERMVAAEEGMGDGDAALLSRISQALAALDARPDEGDAPPTKQGGR